MTPCFRSPSRIQACPLDVSRTNRLTRLGVHFLLIGTFAMFGGALRGFNLLLVLAGMMVGVFIMHWRWSLRSIESMSVNRRLPSEAFAGKPFRVRYRLQNHSRLIPAWMIRVEDQIQRQVTSSARWLEPTKTSCGIGVVSPNRTELTSLDCLISERGLYRFGPVSVSTTFPFSLFLSRKSFSSEQSLHVYPPLAKLSGSWRRSLVSRPGGTATTARRSGTSEGDFYGLREWQSGDHPKWIHWRTSARLNELAVRQFEQQRRFELCLLLDGFSPDDHDGDIHVEHAISLAAALIVQLVGRPSNQLALAIAGDKTSSITSGGNDLGKRRMLEELAAIEPTTTPQLVGAISKSFEQLGHTRDLIVISPRSQSLAMLVEPTLRSAMTPWMRGGKMRWIDVTETELQRWVRFESNHA